MASDLFNTVVTDDGDVVILSGKPDYSIDVYQFNVQNLDTLVSVDITLKEGDGDDTTIIGPITISPLGMLSLESASGAIFSLEKNKDLVLNSSGDTAASSLLVFGKRKYA